LESGKIRPTPCAEGVGEALSTYRRAFVLNVDIHSPEQDHTTGLRKAEGGKPLELEE